MSAELIAAAELGEEARKFLESDVGKVLLGLAEQEAKLAQEDLGEIDPTDTKKIMELQNRIRCSKWFQQWLIELVSDGNQAMSIFQQELEQT